MSKLTIQQNICNLLILILGASYTFSIIPCQAQTPIELNSKNSSDRNSINSDASSTKKLSDAVKSTSISEPAILTEASNSSAANTNVPATKPKLRIPIFSRVFPAPSMQQ